jgi:hypothetical protein
MEHSLPREAAPSCGSALNRHDTEYRRIPGIPGGVLRWFHLTGDVTATGMQAITYLERHAVAMARSVRDLLSI